MEASGVDFQSSGGHLACDHQFAVSNREAVMKSSEPQCEIALMLCESLIHLLVEEGVIAKHKAIEVIEGVAELASEMGANGSASAGRKRNAAALVETIAESFRLKD
jgi:hypothetical protein